MTDAKNDPGFLVAVHNLLDPNARPLIYTCSPEDAVIAAYAQARNDFSTWDYQARYGHLLLRGKITVKCGDFVAFYRCPFCEKEMPHYYQLGNTIGCQDCIAKAGKRLAKMNAANKAAGERK